MGKGDGRPLRTSLFLNSRTSGEIISEDLRSLLESLGRTRHVDKNDFIFREGSDAQEIYIIKSGLVQVTKLTADGKELILRICRKSDIVGELTLFSDNPKYLLSGKALQPTDVLVIQKDILEETLLSNQSLAFEFMRWTHNHMRKFQSKIRDLLLNGKKGALYSTLIRLSNSYGIKMEDGILIDLILTNQDLAKFCAATRESVNRMLGKLRKDGIISIEKSGKIFIKDIQYLKDEIGCEDCPIEICNIN